MLCGVLRDGEEVYRRRGGERVHFYKYGDVFSSGIPVGDAMSGLGGGVRTCAVMDGVCASLNRKLLVRCIT
jgi:hypothetical protein